MDRFGDPNRPVMNLIEIAHLKNLCSQLAIDLVTEKNSQLNMRFSLAADIDLIRVLVAVKKVPNCLKVQGGNPPTLVYFERNKSAEELLKGAVKVMEQVVQEFAANKGGDGE